MRIITRIKLLAAALALSAGTAAAASLSYTETFDDDSHFADGATCPTGWVSTGTYPFARQAGSYVGTDAHSGSYVLAAMPSAANNRDETVYTPLMPMERGVTYTLSFWLKAPGGRPATVRYTRLTVSAGTAQQPDALTRVGETVDYAVDDWKQQTFTFTPTADGDYCFALTASTQIGQSGYVYLDDLTVTGGRAEPPTTDKEEAELPYSQSFDNENGDYDGTTWVPRGWLSTGTSPFITANVDDLKAVTGDYYLVSTESAVSRDERLYTPFFRMEQGVTYDISLYLYMPGHLTHSDFTLSVGTEQDAEFHTPLLTLQQVAYTQWTEVKATFIPQADGLYCFAFALTGESNYAGPCCIDDFLVTAPGSVWKPKAAFAYNGLYDIMDSRLLAFSGGGLQMVNLSEHADTYHWEAEGAEPATSDEAAPRFTFPASGTYTIRLTASNTRGESTATGQIDVAYVTDAEGMGLFAYNPTADKVLNRPDIPTYPTDPAFDFATGINHYYHCVAQRFDAPSGQQFELTTLNFFLTHYGISTRNFNHETGSRLRVAVYGEKDGRPDPDGLYGYYDTTVKDVLGTLSINIGEMRSIAFDRPIKATGPFYVALEFADDLTIDEPDANLSRTSIGLGGVRHQSGVSTLYVLPTAVPEGSSCQPDGTYYPVDNVAPELKGLGLSLIVWGNTHGEATAIALAADGRPAFAARLAGDKLCVSGTEAGERVTLYTAAGQAVAAHTAQGAGTELNVSTLPAGTYIVVARAGTQKFVKP